MTFGNRGYGRLGQACIEMHDALLLSEGGTSVVKWSETPCFCPIIFNSAPFFFSRSIPHLSYK